MDEDLEYFQPGFDPSTLTMPVLRNLLLKYDIHYQNKANKAKLVELFDSELKQKASTILKEYTYMKPSKNIDVSAYGSIKEPPVTKRWSRMSPKPATVFSIVRPSG